MLPTLIGIALGWNLGRILGHITFLILEGK
jgi:hypothetical protein